MVLLCIHELRFKHDKSRVVDVAIDRVVLNVTFFTTSRRRRRRDAARPGTNCKAATSVRTGSLKGGVVGCDPCQGVAGDTGVDGKVKLV